MSKNMIRRKTPLSEGVSKLCTEGKGGEWSHLENAANRPQIYEELNHYVCDLNLSDVYWPYLSECVYVGDLLTHEGWPGVVVDRISGELKKIGLRRHMFTGYWKRPKVKLRELERELDAIREDITYLTRKRQVVTKLHRELEERIEAAKAAKLKADAEMDLVEDLVGQRKRKAKQDGSVESDLLLSPEPEELKEWPGESVVDFYDEAVGQVGVWG